MFIHSRQEVDSILNIQRKTHNVNHEYTLENNNPSMLTPVRLDFFQGK